VVEHLKVETRFSILYHIFTSYLYHIFISFILYISDNQLQMFKDLMFNYRDSRVNIAPTTYDIFNLIVNTARNYLLLLISI